MAALLSGARKYRLGLVLVHQSLEQLQRRDPDVADAVLANAYARICFRLGDADARKLADGFSHFDAKDLQSLGTGDAIGRLERADFDFNLRTAAVPQSSDDGAVRERKRANLVELSRRTYATLRSEVERELPSPSSADSAEDGESMPVSDAVVDFVENGNAGAAALGRGGAEHRNLQEAIQRFAENRGFRAVIEASCEDGSVDVALEKESLTIACEISVTTPAEHEIENIRKCLAAKYRHVLVLCPDADRFEALQAAVKSALNPSARKCVRLFADLAGLFGHLESLDAPGLKPGMGVAVNYRSPKRGADKNLRTRTLGQAVKDLFRRLTGGARDENEKRK